MKKILKISVFFTILQLIYSCIAYQKITFSNKIYNNSKKERACIILGASHDIKNTFLKPKSYFEFKKLKGKKISICIENGETKLFLIEPGCYKLVKYHIYDCDRYRYVNIPPLNQEDIMASFEVKPGEKVYLGHIITKEMKFKKRFAFWANSFTRKIIDFKTENKDLFDSLGDDFFTNYNKNFRKNDFNAKLMEWKRNRYYTF